MNPRNNESAPVLEHQGASMTNPSPPGKRGHEINAQANTDPRHSRPDGGGAVNMAALREAWEDGYEAIIAIETGDRDRALAWLHKGAIPAAAAFPPGHKAGFGLVLVFGALLKEAAA